MMVYLHFLGGETIPLQVRPRDTTNRILYKAGSGLHLVQAIRKVNFVYQGDVVQEHRSLSDYNIPNGARLWEEGHWACTPQHGRLPGCRWFTQRVAMTVDPSPMWRSTQFHSPLQLAIERGHRDVVISLLRRWPNIITVKDIYGQTPLHVAATCGATPEIIDVLLRVWPEGIHERNAYGNTPVHLAGHAGKIEVLKLFLLKEPDVAMVANHSVALFHALVGKQEVKMIELCLQACPDAAAVRNGMMGELPLHCAAYGGCPEIIEPLLRCYPQGASSTSRFGRIPLHYAASGGHSAAVSLLLKVYPEAVQIYDSKGMTPVFEAMSQNDPEVVRLLFDACPDAVRSTSRSRDEATNVGSTLLRHAILSSVADLSRNAAVIEFVLRMWPEALQVVDHQGKVPLHHAARAHRSVRTVELFLSFWPEGAHVQDYQGEIPLHGAADEKNGDVIERLVRAWPGGVQVRDHLGQTPLHRAAMEYCQHDVFYASFYCRDGGNSSAIDLLLTIWPEGVMCPDSRGSTPLYLSMIGEWVTELTVATLFLERYPEAAQEVDADGDTLLHVVASMEDPWGLQERILLLLRYWPEGAAVRNAGGQLPEDCAARYGHQHLVALLDDARHGRPVKLSTTQETPVNDDLYRGRQFYTLRKPDVTSSM